MAQLPVEVAEIIFEYLDKDCCNVGLVCRTWHSIYLRMVWRTLHVEVYEHILSFRHKLRTYDATIKIMRLPNGRSMIDGATVQRLNAMLLAIERARKCIRQVKMLFLKAPTYDSITMLNVLRSICQAAEPTRLVCDVCYGADWSTVHAAVDVVCNVPAETEKRVAIQAVDFDTERFVTRFLQRIRESPCSSGISLAIEFVLTRGIQPSFFHNYGDLIERMQLDDSGKEFRGGFRYVNQLIASCRNLQELLISLMKRGEDDERTGMRELTLPHQIKKFTLSNFSQAPVTVCAQDLGTAVLCQDHSGMSAITLRALRLQALTIYSQHWANSHLTHLTKSLPEIDQLTIYGLELRESIGPFIPLLKLTQIRVSCLPIQTFPYNFEEPAPCCDHLMALHVFTTLVNLCLPILELCIPIPFESIPELFNFVKLCTARMTKLVSLQIWTQYSTVGTDELRRCPFLIRDFDHLYRVDMARVREFQSMYPLPALRLLWQNKY
ncbi:hypothetical protein TRVA0_026S00672 [Trichomonascus vanleenenianus]|uniref:F-box protein n=1 Tax=Trichomonascus vanleenenianus TaxID=2268995 RepID=UPI003EC9BC9B